MDCTTLPDQTPVEVGVVDDDMVIGDQQFDQPRVYLWPFRRLTNHAIIDTVNRDRVGWNPLPRLDQGVEQHPSSVVDNGDVDDLVRIPRPVVSVSR